MKSVIIFTIALCTTFEVFSAQAPTQADVKLLHEDLEEYEFEINMADTDKEYQRVSRLTHQKSKQWVQQTLTYPKPLSHLCKYFTECDASCAVSEASLWKYFANTREAMLHRILTTNQQFISNPAIILWPALPTGDKNLRPKGQMNVATSAAAAAASSPAKPVRSVEPDGEPDHEDPVQPGLNIKQNLSK